MWFRFRKISIRRKRSSAGDFYFLFNRSLADLENQLQFSPEIEISKSSEIIKALNAEFLIELSSDYRIRHFNVVRSLLLISNSIKNGFRFFATDGPILLASSQNAGENAFKLTRSPIFIIYNFQYEERFEKFWKKKSVSRSIGPPNACVVQQLSVLIKLNLPLRERV